MRSIVRLEFKPQDLWVGVYWKTYPETMYKVYSIWVCLLPMVPLHLVFYQKVL
jgi:hypothetical protein